MAKFSIEAIFKAIDKVSAPVTRMSSRVRKATRAMGAGVKKVGNAFRKMGQTAMSSLGVIGVAGALLAVKAAIGAVITKGAELEQTLVGAASRFPSQIRKGTEAFKELEAISRELGATTEFTATQAAGGLNFLAKAGFNAKQSMGLLPGLVDLATASELDLARASDIASDSIGAFGLRVNDAAQLQENFERVSDQMAKTTNIANTNMEELFETIQKGAAPATAAGVPMQDFLALTAQLASSGLKASVSGTALKNVFLKLADVKVQKKLKGMGVSVKDSAGEMRDFADIMDDFVGSTSDLTKIERAGVLNELFGLRGITAVANVLQSGTGEFRRLRKEIEGSTGSTAELAARMRDTRQGQINTLKSAVESLTLTFSSANNEGIEVMIKGLTSLVRGVDSFVKEHPGVAKLLALFVALAVAGLVVAAVFAGVAAAVAFVSASVAALVAMAAVAAVAFSLWFAELKPVQDFFDGFFTMLFKGVEIIGNLASAVGGFVGGVFGDDEEAGTEAGAGVAAGVVSPQDRLAQSIEERREVNDATLTIKGNTDGAELEQKGTAGGLKIQMEPTGAF